jgi:hypothetical protein
VRKTIAISHGFPLDLSWGHCGTLINATAKKWKYFAKLTREIYALFLKENENRYQLNLQ